MAKIHIKPTPCEEIERSIGEIRLAAEEILAVLGRNPSRMEEIFAWQRRSPSAMGDGFSRRDNDEMMAEPS